MTDIKHYISALDGLGDAEDSIFLYDTVDLELTENFVIETGVIGFTDEGSSFEYTEKRAEFDL